MDLETRRRERREMISLQLERRGILDERILQAFDTVPRELFMPPQYAGRAYLDGAAPIGFGQTISQPYIVALMTQLLAAAPGSWVLEVGGGSGYQAAILGKLCAQVHSIELNAVLAQRARTALRQSGLHNVAVHCLDGGFGWPYAAPFDGILIAAAVRHPPAPLLAQLSAAGRLVAPCGDRNGQVLTVWERTSGGFSRQRFEGVRFVPLRGAFGWTQAEWPESDE
jgi:protein-L-isoaspartate(D-aspartate) O-methyltransferase